MPDHPTLVAPPKCIGIAADHGGFSLKSYLAEMLRTTDGEVIDFGNTRLVPDDDHPDFVVPLARVVACADVGVGACIAANKVAGVRACLIYEGFWVRQGVEDDDMNLICLGGQVVSNALAWDLLRTFLDARFSGAERHRRRVAKVASVESGGPQL